ncbi:hypothetical protein D3C80_1592130 [compost metagenome]
MTVRAVQRQVAELMQVFAQRMTHVIFIFQHQYQTVGAVAFFERQGRCLGDCRCRGARQLQTHQSAFARCGFNLHPAAGLANKAVNHRQPQPAAAADCLGGEERFEHLRFHFLRHAAAGVDHLQRHHVLFFATAAHHSLVIDTDLDHAAAAFHGIPGVDYQVDQRVFQLIGIHPRRPAGPLSLNA